MQRLNPGKRCNETPYPGRDILLLHRDPFQEVGAGSGKGRLVPSRFFGNQCLLLSIPAGRQKTLSLLVFPHHFLHFLNESANLFLIGEESDEVFRGYFSVFMGQPVPVRDKD